VNTLQRAIDRWQHPGENEQMRERRRWRRALSKQETQDEQIGPRVRVDIICRCGHAHARHVIASAAVAACDECTECTMFRAERISRS
jgi:hypothetical protein